MSALSTVLSTHIRRRRKFGEISCTECTGQWNSNSVNGTRNPIKGYFGSEFLAIYNHCRVMAAWSRKMLKICERGCKEVFGKTTLMEKFSKFCSKSFHHDTNRHVEWNMADRKSVKSCVAYMTNKISPGSAAVATMQIMPAPTMYSECSRFHPNRFTFSGVIAERVNTAKTCRKVNPIFGWSLASSRITIHLIKCIQWNKFN